MCVCGLCVSVCFSVCVVWFVLVCVFCVLVYEYCVVCVSVVCVLMCVWFVCVCVVCG